MNTQHPSNNQPSPGPLRPFRCLRHRPWMASCEDCRKAHSTPPASGAAATTAAR